MVIKINKEKKRRWGEHCNRKMEKVKIKTRTGAATLQLGCARAE